MGDESMGQESDKPIYAVTSFEPDEDNWTFGLERARAIHKNMNLLSYVRKTLIPNNLEKFQSGVEHLKDNLQEGAMPPGWLCEKHDKELLI
jgi:hypothetical protein